MLFLVLSAAYLVSSSSGNSWIISTRMLKAFLFSSWKLLRSSFALSALTLRPLARPANSLLRFSYLSQLNQACNSSRLIWFDFELFNVWQYMNKYLSNFRSSLVIGIVLTSKLKNFVNYDNAASSQGVRVSGFFFFISIKYFCNHVLLLETY